MPPTTGLRFRLAESGRVVVRPSGTEPKLKCYLEVVVPVDDDEDVTAGGRWAGVLPVRTVFEEPRPCPLLTPGSTTPAHVLAR